MCIRDSYTPREVIRLMVNVLLAEGCNDLLTDEGKIATVLDAACGSGGMLSTTYDFLRRKNPYVDVRLFGQEINPESYAICPVSYTHLDVYKRQVLSD